MIAEPRTAPRPVAASEGEEQTFGARVRAAREQRRWSPRYLAGRIDVSAATVLWIETDRWMPEAQYREKLERLLPEIVPEIVAPAEEHAAEEPAPVLSRPGTAPAAIAAEPAPVPMQSLGIGGIGCPECGDNGRVVDSRENALGMRRRRRECRAHGTRWSTLEITGDLESLLGAVRRAQDARDALDEVLAAFRLGAAVVPSAATPGGEG